MLYNATKDITANLIQDSVVNDNSSLFSVMNTIEINNIEQSTSTTILSTYDPPLEPIVVINTSGDSGIEEIISEEQIEMEDSEKMTKNSHR